MKKLAAASTALAVLAVGAFPAAATHKNVRVTDNEFLPATRSVAKGHTVRWRWTGDNPHNVKVTKGPVKFRSAVKRSGTFSRTLRRRGTYRIVCEIHSGMRMTLKVG